MPRTVTLLLAGDVMTGRGLDQALPHPGDPTLYEAHVRSAEAYLRLAERAGGPIPWPVPFAYPWGEALVERARIRPDLVLANLETAITARGVPAPKGINYRMHPANLPCLAAFGADCWSLANNHILDWGEAGLRDTLGHLDRAALGHAGAGRTAAAAAAPFVKPLPAGGRILVFAFALPSSGVPLSWAAGTERPGVVVLPDLSDASLFAVAHRVGAERRPGDLVVASVHWGSNWGYRVDPAEHRFARGLIELAGVDLVHGHSSHHPRPLELYKGRLVLYGCGDLLNDYEGIGGREEYRPEIVALYAVSLETDSGRLASLEIVPFRLARFSLTRAGAEEAGWLAAILTREGGSEGAALAAGPDGRVRLAAAPGRAPIIG